MKPDKSKFPFSYKHVRMYILWYTQASGNDSRDNVGIQTIVSVLTTEIHNTIIL